MEGVKFKFPDDLIAGITGSIAAIPDAMASGLMAKMNPINGLYATILGHLIGTWTTSSVFMTVATTSTLALAAGSALDSISKAERIGALITLSILVGLIQVLMGVFKMHFLLRFVSNSVMRGFLTGISVLIIIGQISEFAGVDNVKMENKVLKFFKIMSEPSQWNLYTILAGVSTILVVLLINKTKLKHLSFFIALVFVSVAVYFLDEQSVLLIGQKYHIPSGLPSFVMPNIKLIPKLLPSSIAIALIGFVQGAGISHIKPNPSGEYPNVSQDLVGQGLSNVAGGVFSGIPIGGSITQSTINYSVGAKSRWSNCISGILVCLMVFFLSSLIELLPLACLAATLIIIGFESINKDDFASIWETSWQSRVVMLFSFAITLAVSVQIAVLISVVLTFFLYVIRSANSITIRSLVPEKEDFKEQEVPKMVKAHSIIAIEPKGSLFFAGAFALSEKLPNPDTSDRSVVLFLLGGKEEIGNTLMTVLEDYAKKLLKHKSKLVLIGVTANVYHQLKRTRVLNCIGESNIYMDSDLLEKPLRDAWRDSEKWLKENQ